MYLYIYTYVHLNPLPVPCTILRYTGVLAALGSVVPGILHSVKEPARVGSVKEPGLEDYGFCLYPPSFESLVRGLTYKH